MAKLSGFVLIVMSNQWHSLPYSVKVFALNVYVYSPSSTKCVISESKSVDGSGSGNVVYRQAEVTPTSIDQIANTGGELVVGMNVESKPIMC